jgi:hypothetical protein
VSLLEENEKQRKEIEMHEHSKTIKKEIDETQKNPLNHEMYDGVIYLLQEREFKKTQEPIYKVGRTQCLTRRMSQYPKGSEIFLSISSKNVYEKEKEILKHFEKYFFQRKEIGREYFEGNVLNMHDDIINMFQTERRF